MTADIEDAIDPETETFSVDAAAAKLFRSSLQLIHRRCIALHTTVEDEETLGYTKMLKQQALILQMLLTHLLSIRSYGSSRSR